MGLPTDDTTGRPESPPRGDEMEGGERRALDTPGVGVHVACPVNDCNTLVTARCHPVAEDFLKAAYDEDHPYFSLADVLLKAYEQAAMGKGRERHAQDRSFADQPMQALCGLLGSAEGPAYQAMKKVQESQRMGHEAAVRELLGAIVYLAGAVLYRETVHTATKS